jgi:WD40 repeat protein
MALPGRGGKIGSGRRAVSASRDETLKVWDLETGTVITAFSCDAGALWRLRRRRRIVAGDDSGRVQLLSLEPSDHN